MWQLRYHSPGGAWKFQNHLILQHPNQKHTESIQELTDRSSRHPLKKNVDVGVGALTAIVCYDVGMAELLKSLDLSFKLLRAVKELPLCRLITWNWLLDLRRHHKLSKHTNAMHFIVQL
jgi:hypothetical protein